MVKVAVTRVRRHSRFWPALLVAVLVAGSGTADAWSRQSGQAPKPEPGVSRVAYVHLCAKSSVMYDTSAKECGTMPDSRPYFCQEDQPLTLGSYVNGASKSTPIVPIDAGEMSFSISQTGFSQNPLSSPLEMTSPVRMRTIKGVVMGGLADAYELPKLPVGDFEVQASFSGASITQTRRSRNGSALSFVIEMPPATMLARAQFSIRPCASQFGVGWSTNSRSPTGEVWRPFAYMFWRRGRTVTPACPWDRVSVEWNAYAGPEFGGRLLASKLMPAGSENCNTEFFTRYGKMPVRRIELVRWIFPTRKHVSSREFPFS